MKAMVFAAGVGSRLKELTQSTPKCLVDLGDGTTMLGRVLTNLRRAGVVSVMINLHHLPDRIEEYLASHQFGLQIAFSKEEKLLGTGGGLKKAAWFFDDGKPFIVHNSDIYTDLDLRALVSYHAGHNGIGTLATMDRPTGRHLLFDGDNALVGWENKDVPPVLIKNSEQVRKAAFSGIQVLHPEIFEYMKSHDGDFSTISAYLTAAEAGEKLYSFDMSHAYWIDMGTPEKLRELQGTLKGQNGY